MTPVLSSFRPLRMMPAHERQRVALKSVTDAVRLRVLAATLTFGYNSVADAAKHLGEVLDQLDQG